MIPFQLDESAKAPWTRTIVGGIVRSFRLGDRSEPLAAALPYVVVPSVGERTLEAALPLYR
jgi:hypothetical protein